MVMRWVRTLVLGVAGAIAVAVPMRAQAPAAAPEIHIKGDIAGDWQGTLQAGKSLRLVAKITKAEKGWAAKFYSIDQGGQAIAVSAITLDGAAVKMNIEMIGGTFEGTLSSDGNTMAGNWNQGGTPLPLTLVRATKETAWEIPVPPPPAKTMAPDADPAFDVATIKPNNSGATSMQGLVINGRKFITRASSLGDLIAFAYEVQTKQIVGAPDWINQDRYDIEATPDAEGVPNPAQIRIMIRKLLADRFKLTFHNDKRDLSAFVLTVAKGGQKLTPTELKGPLPGLFYRPTPGGIALTVRNAAMRDFTGFMQSLVLDRPVVDQTGLTDRYDFVVKFLPDDSEFNGHPPPMPAKADGVADQPGLFEAMQQQLGLKLDAQKTSVPVMAVDHAEKPSAN